MSAKDIGLRADVARLEQLVCDFQAASMLERGGDPGGVKPSDVEREVTRLRADVARKDEALLAAYGIMLSTRQILRDLMYRDTPVSPGRLKQAADSCESTGRVITVALAVSGGTGSGDKGALVIRKAGGM